MTVLAMTTPVPTTPRIPLRLVVIDDTPDIRLLLRVALEAQGQFAVVAEAGDGRTGVDLVREHQPDAVLLDLAMPVMDGLEALPLIRAASPQSRVIVLSGFETSSMAERVITEGATAFIQKGASARTIVAEVAETLGVRPAHGTTPVVPASGEIERVHTALATAAHELRGPATVLIAMSELLSTDRGTLDDGTFNQMLDAIARQAHVLDRVTGDLLSSTQSQRGVLRVDVEPAQLLPIAMSSALSVAGETAIDLDCPDDVWVLSDPTRLQQMLGNLISNAVKYGAAPFGLTARRAGGSVTIAVTDHGAGVPPEFRPKLFEQFSRAPGAKVKGLGLGLFLVRSLAEAQGGGVDYEPLPGGGSSFRITLQAADPTG
ncbi:response regulator [Jatrophihabitans sp.]|uniref:response regulator n=1 Tax=Jatrophihabitans sp. TaxID=1932789 RepID=UPI0030C6A232|nr:ATP-binding region, ATPase domain protein [Jatrophihabitans sp.]